MLRALTTTRIGLVDDDDRFRISVSRALENAPPMQLWFDTSTAQGAIEWMRACDAAAWPDIWLVSFALPDGSGLKVVQEATRLHPHTRVIMLSGTPDGLAVLDSLGAGAVGYLLKDPDGDRLVEHIFDLMNGGAPLSSQVARCLVDQVRAIGAHNLSNARPPQMTERPLLTGREVMTLRLVAKGCSYQEVAEHLKVKTNTVRYFIKGIYRKMKVSSKTEALYEARRRGWILDM